MKMQVYKSKNACMNIKECMHGHGRFVVCIGLTAKGEYGSL